MTHIPITSFVKICQLVLKLNFGTYIVLYLLGIKLRYILKDTYKIPFLSTVKNTVKEVSQQGRQLGIEEQ